jgi:hypothetical protein
MLIDDPSDARVAFLRALIDDAALFPPSSLPMAEAASQHHESRTGPHGWMLGRFLCPATRLAELVPQLPAFDEGRPWELSVVLDAVHANAHPDGLHRQLGIARRFARDAAGRASIRVVELKLPPHDAWDRRSARSTVEAALAAVERARLPEPAMPVLEIPGGPDWRRVVPESIGAVAELRAASGGSGLPAPGAKIRCGGGTADAIPSPEHVAAFVDACRRSDVPFKATAGLHHPFRHADPATGFVRHGFLNVAGAAVMACAAGADRATLARMIADDRPASFRLGPEGFRWQDLVAGPRAIASARRELFLGYGSCSFTEPVEDLVALGVLPAGMA